MLVGVLFLMEVEWTEMAYLSELYCLCYIKKRRMLVLKEKLRLERYPKLKINEDISLCDNRGKHWKEMPEENIEDKG